MNWIDSPRTYKGPEGEPVKMTTGNMVNPTPVTCAREQYEILREALEKIYGTPQMTLIGAREIARLTLENTDGGDPRPTKFAPSQEAMDWLKAQSLVDPLAREILYKVYGFE